MRPPHRRNVLAVTLALSSLALLQPGCTEQHDAETDFVALPVAGKADQVHHADRACQVVLREAGVLAGGTPIQTITYEGRNYFLYGAVVDVAADVDEQATLGLAGRQVISIEPADESPAGFVRYVINFLGPNTGISSTSLNSTHIQIIPFIDLADGSRNWDHNRNPGDFDNYDLFRENGFKIGDNVRICSSSDVEPTTWQAAVHCDGAVLDVDVNDPTHFQLVVDHAQAVQTLAAPASDAHGATRLVGDPTKIISEGYGAYSGNNGASFSEFQTVPTFDSLDVWHTSGSATARVARHWSEMHLTLVNTTDDGYLPRCAENRYATRCVVADWIFRNCY